MITWEPSARLVRSNDGKRRRIATSAAVDETNRTVVADRVQRADTFMGRLVGLLGRDGLAEDEALWISPCSGIHTFGMSFPIDVIFMDATLRVVAVREGITPWRATGFVREAASVLELPTGAIRRVGVAVGHQMGFVPDFHGKDETRDLREEN